jgi:DNA-binding CsgD family transcriptional regulator
MDVIANLQALGLSEVAARAYEPLVDLHSCDVTTLAQILRIGRRRAEDALRELEQAGLVTRTPQVPPSYITVAPELAIESLLQRRVAELDEVRRAATQLGERHRASRVQPRAPVVELVSGYEATLAWAMQVQQAAAEEVRLIDVPPYVLPPGPPNPVEGDLLAAGVRYRVLYHVTSFDFPAKREAARQCIAQGEQARVYYGTPIKMILADRRIGFAYDTKVQPIQDSLVVHPSFLLDQLGMLFDLLWDRAAPVTFGAQSRSRLEPLDQEILALLGAGAKDETISRQLDIGVRTVRRRVAALMADLGAVTRFQAGFLAAKHGLL